jgi:hypothetical protein
MWVFFRFLINYFALIGTICMLKTSMIKVMWVGFCPIIYSSHIIQLIANLTRTSSCTMQLCQLNSYSQTCMFIILNKWITSEFNTPTYWVAFPELLASHILPWGKIIKLNREMVTSIIFTLPYPEKFPHSIPPLRFHE